MKTDLGNGVHVVPAIAAEGLWHSGVRKDAATEGSDKGTPTRPVTRTRNSRLKLAATSSSRSFSQRGSTEAGGTLCTGSCPVLSGAGWCSSTVPAVGGLAKDSLSGGSERAVPASSDGLYACCCDSPPTTRLEGAYDERLGVGFSCVPSPRKSAGRLASHGSCDVGRGRTPRIWGEVSSSLARPNIVPRMPSRPCSRSWRARIVVRISATSENAPNASVSSGPGSGTDSRAVPGGEELVVGMASWLRVGSAAAGIEAVGNGVAAMA